MGTNLPPDGARELFLSRRGNGLFMLTNKPPILSRLGQTSKYELYIAPGDMVGLNNLCVLGTRVMFGEEAAKLPRLACVRVWSLNGVISPQRVDLPKADDTAGS